MDIALDRGKNDPSLYLLGLSLEVFLHHFKSSLSGFRAHQKLRQKDRSGFKSFSHLIEGGNQVPVDQIQRSRIL